MDEYKRYKKVFKNILKTNVTKVRDKFKDPKTCYFRAARRVKSIQRYGLKHGLDIGCADSSMIIVAQMRGINITGIDYEKCPYRYMQQRLGNIGYSIHLVSLDDMKYEFLNDGEYEFIVTCGVIYAMYKSVKGTREFKEEALEARLLSLVNKLKDGAIWFINNKSHLKMILRCAGVKRAIKSKNIKFKHIR